MLGLCECGCGQKTPVSKKTVREKNWIKGQPHRFIHGHHSKVRVWTAEMLHNLSVGLKGVNLGRVLSPETCKKMGDSRRGEKNYGWKGDAAGYHAIHIWLNTYYPKSGICEHCGSSPNGKRQHDYANISGEYRRDRSDYLELCSKCHKAMDVERGRTGRLLRKQGVAAQFIRPPKLGSAQLLGGPTAWKSEIVNGVAYKIPLY